MDARPVKFSQTVMTELVHPTHTNSLNSVFGGQVVAWIDICAAIAAQRHCSRPVVTASIDALDFVQPVYTGWVINLKASVNYVSRTSLEVGVRVDAENPTTNEHFHTASAYLTFVALDDRGKPTAAPKVIAETEAEKRRYNAAIRRREIRMQARSIK